MDITFDPRTIGMQIDDTIMQKNLSARLALVNKKYFPGRKVLIAKELTKIHEAFFRENIDEIKLFKNPMKGELTVIISEKNLKTKVVDEKKIVNKAKKYLKKYSLKDTVDLILESEKSNRRDIYKLCLKLKNEKNT